MIAIKVAIFVGLVTALMWAGMNLATTAVSAWPKWAIIEGSGAIGCLYALTDLAYRWREWVGWRGEPRRSHGPVWRRW